MSLCFSGSRGAVEQRWIVYALLRDNVQHHLEGGVPSGRFEMIHRAAEALGGGTVQLGARQLHDELLRAQSVLAGRSISDLAIAPSTWAVVEGRWPVSDEAEVTRLAREQGRVIPWLPGNRATLDEVFGHLVRDLLAATSGAGPTDLLDVWDG